MGYLWQTGDLICYDRIHPTQYVFHEDTETCTPVYTVFCDDYALFRLMEEEIGNFCRHGQDNASRGR